MRKTQQMIVLLGLGIIVLMGIFPPWTFVDDNKVAHDMGYAPIWKPPVQQSHESAQFLGIKLQLDSQSQSANSIDLAKLLIQIVIVGVVSGGAGVLMKKAFT